MAAGTANKLSLDPYGDLFKLKLQALKSNVVIEEDNNSNAVYVDQELPVDDEIPSNNKSNVDETENTTSQSQNDLPRIAPPAQEDVPSSVRELVFAQDQYLIDVGQNVELESYLTLPGDLESLSYEVFFNSDIVQFLGAELEDSSVGNLDIQYETGSNLVVLNFTSGSQRSESNLQTKFTFRGKRTGTSFLVMRNLDGTFRVGSGINFDVKNSRIKVQ